MDGLTRQANGGQALCPLRYRERSEPAEPPLEIALPVRGEELAMDKRFSYPVE